MALCERCRPTYEAWLDYRTHQPIALVAIGRSSARDVMEANRHRADERQRLVRARRREIIEHCLAGEHVVRHDGSYSFRKDDDG